MQNLIEKIKGLDKKILIGAGIGIALVIILVIALIIGGSKPAAGNKNNSQQGSQPGTQAGTQAGSELVGSEGLGTENLGTENIGTEALGTEMETEIATEVGTETEMPETEVESEEQNESESSSESESQSESESESESQSESDDGTTVTHPESVDGVEQKPITTTPEGEEIMGEGSESQPYEINPVNQSFTTVSISAGSSKFFNVMKTVGKIFVIEDADAYVKYNGTTYEAKNGKVSFQVYADRAIPTDALLFEIGNNGSSAKEFTVKLYDVSGSSDAPESISGNGPFSKHLDAGDTTGWFYKMSAEQSGTLRIYMTATANSDLEATNNKDGSGNEGTVQRSFSNSDEQYTDDQGNAYIELEVEDGDEIVIHVIGIKPARGTTPETDITFELAYQ